MTAPAGVFRTLVRNRLGGRVVWMPVANLRRRGSVSLQGRFTACADRAAQGRPDPTAPLRSL
jgi:hypothetical protein